MRFAERQQKVQRRLEQLLLDGLLITALPNIRYLTGFTGSTALLLITHTDALFITDSRYTLQASRQVTGQIVPVPTGKKYPETAVARIKEARLTRLGFESAHLTHQHLGQFSKQLGQEVELVPTENVVDDLRLVKDQEEIEAIRRAVELTSEVFEDFVNDIKPGVREQDLAVELEYRLRRRGAERLAFDTILASGARAALPHGRASDKVIGQNEFVVCDLGIVLDGYCSDMTRTVYVGNPDGQAREIYDIVLQAQLNCERRMRGGMESRAIDDLTRQVIAGHGYDEYYGHSTGHGVGLEVHEAPRVSPAADGAVPVGAVITVEPGIYLPEWGGVRIEDVVVVTETGCEVLTPTPKEMVAV
jgi:Xaa-Pro aminopeptidase